MAATTSSKLIGSCTHLLTSAPSAGRLGGILFGLGNQILFLVTVWYLFWFLRDGPRGGLRSGWLVMDAGMALLFAVLHSVVLYPATRRWLQQWIPPAFYGSFLCTITCLSLLLLFSVWRTSGFVLWDVLGWSRAVIRAGFYACWVALAYSMWLTGLGYQSGWTPFWYWLRGEAPPRRAFRPRGAYLWLRHPVYLSFLGLLWLTPRMSLDHALLTAIWTIYSFYGSCLKDRRLELFIGEPYREYARKVPGYPLVFGGPLGRWPLPRETGEAAAAVQAADTDPGAPTNRPDADHRVR